MTSQNSGYIQIPSMEGRSPKRLLEYASNEWESNKKQRQDSNEPDIMLVPDEQQEEATITAEIVLEDHASPSYGAGLQLFDSTDASLSEQFKFIHDSIEWRRNQNVIYVVYLTAWMARHLQESRSTWMDSYERYCDEDNTFSEISAVALKLLDTRLFFSDTERYNMSNLIILFCQSCLHLSLRMCYWLQYLIDHPEQQATLLEKPFFGIAYPQLLCRVITARNHLKAQIAASDKQYEHIMLSTMIKALDDPLLGEAMANLMPSLVRTIIGPQTLPGLWSTLDSISGAMSSSIIPIAVYQSRRGRLVCGKYMLNFIKVLKDEVLPFVSTQQPKSMPAEFLLRFVQNMHATIRNAFKTMSEDEYTFVYEHSPLATNVPTLRQFAEAPSKEQKMESLGLSWVLYAALNLIRSDLEHLRITGMQLLNYSCIKELDPQPDANRFMFYEPFAQQIAEHLAESGLINILFGSNTSIRLLAQSSAIMAFMIDQKCWSTEFSDIVWQSCIDCEDAALLHKTLVVMYEAVKHMSHDELLYLTQKYAEIPTESFTPSISSFLECTLPMMATKDESLDNKCDMSRVSQLCLQLLENTPKVDHSQVVANIKTAATIQILTQLKTPACYLVLEACRDLLHCSKDVDPGFEMLRQILDAEIDETDLDRLLELIPIDMVLDHLCSWTETYNNRIPTPDTDVHFRTHLHCLLRLVSIKGEGLSVDAQSKLRENTIGSALSSHYRDVAIYEMLTLHKNDQLDDATEQIVHDLLLETVAEPGEILANIMVVNYLRAHLEERIAASDNDTIATVISDPVWLGLLHVAFDAKLDHLAGAAHRAIGSTIFGGPYNAIKRQYLITAFVNQIIGTVSEILEKYGPLTAQEDAKVERLLSICYSLRRHSSDAEQNDTQTSEKIQLLNDDEETSMTILLKLPNPYTPRQIFATLPSNARIGSLLDIVRDRTGIEDHLIQKDGLDVDAETFKDLAISELEFCGKHEIIVTPQPVADSDLSKVYPIKDPVVKALYQHRDTLKGFLACRRETSRAREALGGLPLFQLQAEVLDPDLFSEQWPETNQGIISFSLLVLDDYRDICKEIKLQDTDFHRRCISTLSQVLLSDAYLISPTIRRQLCIALTRSFKDATTKTYKRADDIQELRPLLQRVINLLVSGAKQANFSLADGKLFLSLYELMLQIIFLDYRLWREINQDSFQNTHRDVYLRIDKKSVDELCHMIEDAIERCSEVFGPAYVSVFAKLVDVITYRPASMAVVLDMMNKVIKQRLSEKHFRDADKLQAIAVLTDVLVRYRHLEICNQGDMDYTLYSLLELLFTCVKSGKGINNASEMETLARCLLNQYLYPVESSKKESSPPVRLDALKIQSAVTTPASIDSTNIQSAATTPASTELEGGDDGTGTNSDLLHFEPVLSSHNRQICTAILKMTWNLGIIDDLMTRLPQYLKIEKTTILPDLESWFRAPDLTSGLTNLGMTCYMNSLLQQIFGNIRLRKAIFDVEITDTEMQGLIRRTRHLFAHMQDSVASPLATNDLVEYLKIAPRVQDDVHSFYTTFMSGLEEQFFNPDQRLAFTQLYTGKMLTQIRGACGHVSSRTDSFADLSITVQNRYDLGSSLDEFVQGERMTGQNQYRCMTCAPDTNGRLVDAAKRTCLTEVPDILTLCLKRFTYDRFGNDMKNNDLFDFYDRIDMARYQRKHLEDPSSPCESDIFVLTGVIVHNGTSTFGHYWSYLLDRNHLNQPGGIWICAEDAKMTTGWTFQEIRDQCMGGADRTYSAYVLIYERLSSLATTQTIINDSISNNPTSNFRNARSSPPDWLWNEVQASNRMHYRTFNAFDNVTHDLITTSASIFTKQIAVVAEQSVDELDEILPGKDAEDGSLFFTSSSDKIERQTTDLLPNRLTLIDESRMKSVAHLMASYLGNILLLQPPGRPFTSFCQLMGTYIKQESFCINFLESFAESIFMARQFSNESHYVRSNTAGFVLQALDVVKSNLDNEQYINTLETIIKSHISLLTNTHVETDPSRWTEYFEFVNTLICDHESALAIVLQQGYVSWVIDTANTYDANMPRRKLVNYALKHDHLKLDTLYAFLEVVLSNLDLSDSSAFAVRGKYATAACLVLPDVPEKKLVGWWRTAFDANMTVEEEHEEWYTIGAAGVMYKLASASDGKIVSFWKEQINKVLLESVQVLPSIIIPLAFCMARGDGMDSSDVMTSMIESFLNEKPVYQLDAISYLHKVENTLPVSVASTLWTWFSWMSSEERVLVMESQRLFENVINNKQPIDLDGQSSMHVLNSKRFNAVGIVLKNCLENLQEQPRPDVNILSLAEWSLERCLRFVKRAEEQVEQKYTNIDSVAAVVALGEQMDSFCNLIDIAQKAMAWDDGRKDSRTITPPDGMTDVVVDAGSSAEGKSKDET